MEVEQPILVQAENDAGLAVLGDDGEYPVVHTVSPEPSGLHAMYGAVTGVYLESPAMPNRFLCGSSSFATA